MTRGLHVSWALCFGLARLLFFLFRLEVTKSTQYFRDFAEILPLLAYTLAICVKYHVVHTGRCDGGDVELSSTFYRFQHYCTYAWPNYCSVFDGI